MTEPIIVRARLGRAQVNWRRDGLVGLTWIDGPARGLSNVLREDEVEWPEGTPATILPDVSRMSDEELRRQLEELRALRASDRQKKPKQRAETPRQPEKPPMETSIEKLLASASPEVLQALREQLAKGRAGSATDRGDAPQD